MRALFLIPKNPPPRLVDDEEVGDPGAATEEDGGRIVSGAGMRPLPESGKRGGGDGGASSSFSAAFKVSVSMDSSTGAAATHTHAQGGLTD